MYDLIITFIIGFLLSLTLLRKVKPITAMILLLIIGGLIGWQVINFLPPTSTSVGWLLDTNPDLNLIWQQTHDMRQVALGSKYAVYMWVGFNALSSLFGSIVATAVYKHRNKF